MSIWTEISKQSTSWTPESDTTTTWTRIGDKTTDWTAQDKETTAFRTLNTYKEIVFLSSYNDSLGLEEISLSNAVDDAFNIKTLNLSRVSWTVV